ncbi:MAG: hypothetical protein EA380_11135 [Phycisphaeraceae bacterium]|nr:MAG: hypothetical protein EA380_11135 [Phycisphaeraceae bacterium]
MHFFFDRNIPVALARMLGCYDQAHTIIYHDDRFEKNTLDTNWLSDIATWDPIPVVVSGDGRILRNPAELQVLRELPLTFFLFAPGWINLKWSDQAWKAVKVWPEIVASASPRRPSVYRVPVSASKVEFVSLTGDLGGKSRPR